MAYSLSAYQNPDKLPVEELTFKISISGEIQSIKALDKHWVSSKRLVLYEPPPIGSAIPGELDAWINLMECHLEDLQWLLSLEHHKFWSNIIYHENCMNALVSFLQEANPPYITLYRVKTVQNLYGQISRRILFIFSRLITNKESETQWMSKEYLGEILFDKFIFTIPIIWDLCLLYGINNRTHISKLVTTIFHLQPKYTDDLEAALNYIKEVLKYITLQVNPLYNIGSEPPNLPEGFGGFRNAKRNAPNRSDEKWTAQGLKDMVLYLLDTALSLRIFVNVYLESIPLLKKHGFHLSIVQLYENAIPSIVEKLEDLADTNTECELTATYNFLDSTRLELIEIFRHIMMDSMESILNNTRDKESEVSEYFSLMMDCLSEKGLVRDYNSAYPISTDIEILTLAYPNIDSVKTDYILQAVYSNLDFNDDQENRGVHKPTSSCNLRPSDSSVTAQHVHHDVPQTGGDIIPENIKTESLITEVRDLFPNLGDGFILKCLEHYGFSSEIVIGCILEDTLDEPLKKIDRSLPLIPSDPIEDQYLQTGIDRINIYDGDEFDVMTRNDVDMSKIHKGKKQLKFKDLNAMLDDKSHVRNMKDVFVKYSILDEDAAIYSDEYDDTYDDDGLVNSGLEQGNPDDARRPVVKPRILQQMDGQSSEEEQIEGPQPSSSSAAGIDFIPRNREEFCINPEVLRARREAARGRGRGRGGVPPTRNVDVVGKAKGQGQDKQVLIARDKKGAHKSSRGNHNRRSGAQWKRNMSMVPS